MPGPFFRKQGREPQFPQAFPEGEAEFAHKGKKYRVVTQGSVATLYSDQDGEWKEEGSTESHARLVDLVTSTTGRYHWRQGDYQGNLPESVERLLKGGA